MFTRIAVGATVAFLALASSAGPAGAALAGGASGRGTGELSVTALRVSVGDVVELHAGRTTAGATLDAERRGLAHNRAVGEVVAAAAEGAGLPALRFPDPPVSAESQAGRKEDRRASTELALPPTGAALEAAAGAAALVGHLVPGAEGSLDGVLTTGSLAGGSFDPAHVVTEMADDTAAVTSTSELGSVTLLGGLSSFAGAGPGEHRAWASPEGAGATADSLHIESATLLDTRSALALLGVDATTLATDTVTDLASALGVPPTGDAVADAPLLAVADVAVTAHAVASVDADGTVKTATSTGGGVGAVLVAGARAGGFGVDDTVDQWDGFQLEVNRLLANVLGLLGPEYRDSVRVRVVPRMVEETVVDGPYAVASAALALLEVQVTPPAVTDGTDPSDPGLVGDLLEELPVDVPGAGGGGADPGPLLGAPAAPATTIVLGEMSVSAEHTRPGVDPDGGCDPACTDTVNLTWTPDAGFGAPARPPGAADLPRTGTDLLFGPAAAILAAAHLARRLTTTTSIVTREESL